MTTLLPSEIKLQFFRILTHEISVSDFEQWVYANGELESVLQEDDYIDLISLNYKTSWASNEISGVLWKYIKYGELQQYKVTAILKRNAELSDLQAILENMYDLYCKGCRFLLPLYAYWRSDYKESAVKEMIYKFIDDIQSGKIVFTGEHDDIDEYEYIDNRNYDETSEVIDRNLHEECYNTKTENSSFSIGSKQNWWLLMLLAYLLLRLFLV